MINYIYNFPNGFCKSKDNKLFNVSFFSNKFLNVYEIITDYPVKSFLQLIVENISKCIGVDNTIKLN